MVLGFVLASGFQDQGFLLHGFRVRHLAGLASKICGIHVQLSWGCCSWVGTLPKQTAQLCDPTPAVASSNPQLHVHRFKKQQTRQEKGCQSSSMIRMYPACAWARIWSRSAPARGPEAFRLSVCPVWSLGRLVFSWLVMSPRPKCFPPLSGMFLCRGVYIDVYRVAQASPPHAHLTPGL